MKHFKYIFFLSVIFNASCGSNTADVAQASTDPIEKRVDAVNRRDVLLITDTALNTTWTDFKKAIATNNLAAFQQLSLDSLETCDILYSVRTFISKCFKEVFDTTLTRKLGEVSDITLTEKGISLSYVGGYALKRAEYNSDGITLKQFQILKALTPDGGWTMTFDFIKTKQGYKFFGCNSYGGPVCCL
jgi:hypothetical protein